MPSVAQGFETLLTTASAYQNLPFQELAVELMMIEPIIVHWRARVFGMSCLVDRLFVGSSLGVLC